MAYFSVSRGSYNSQIYTNNTPTLGAELSRDVSHSPAIQQEPAVQKIESQPAHTRTRLSRVSASVCDPAFPNDTPPIAERIRDPVCGKTLRPGQSVGFARS